MTRNKQRTVRVPAISIVLIAVLTSATLVVWITRSTDGLAALSALVVATLGVLIGRQEER